MKLQKALSPHFEVSVTIQYAQTESKPEENYHLFAYRICIHNKGSFSAQLMSRHWIITDGFGQVEEVRGAGVVGQQPKIEAGQKFEYESACPLPTSCGTMRGSYQLVSSNGEHFDIEIPEFYLVAPSALH